MLFASLYQKYRPQTFSEIIGQPHVAKTLSNAVERGRVFHAYLFSGPRGTGKTSTARILAKAVNCEGGPTPQPCGTCQPCTQIQSGTFPDVFEIDAATHSKVEETRDFLSNVPTGLTALSKKKFYIVDEVHMLSSHAFNALLKTLEEPPDHVVFVLATTEPHKVPPTIAGRCQHFEFRLISPTELASHYMEVCKKEGVEVEPEAIDRVAALARGSVRDGLSLLDQLISATGGRITKESVARIAGDDEVDICEKLAYAIATEDLEASLELIASMVESGKDFRAFAQRFAGYLRNVMIASYLPLRQTQSVASVDSETASQLSSIAKQLGRPSILRCLDIAGEVLASMASGSPPQLAFELGIVRMCRPEEAPSLSELSRAVIELREKLVRLEKSVSSSSITPDAGVTPQTTNQSRQIESPTRSRPPKRADAVSSGGSQPKTRDSASSLGTQPKTADAVSSGGTHDTLAVSSKSLESQWERLLFLLKEAKKMKARALLQEARPVECNGSSLVLEYPEKFEFHAKSALSLRDTIAAEIEAAFGAPLKIEARLVRFSDDGSDNTPEEIPAVASKPSIDMGADELDSESDTSESSVTDMAALQSRSAAKASPPPESTDAEDKNAREIAERLIKDELGGVPIND